MPTAEVIQIIIQGGAVGLLLAFGWGGYRLANKLIDIATSLITNHFHEVTTELSGIKDTVRDLVEELRRK